MAKREYGQRVGRLRRGNPNLPDGKWVPGIANPDIGALVAQVIVALPQIEEEMSPFFGRLLLLPTTSQDVARQLLRSIRTSEGKIGAMSAVLQNSFVHAEKPTIFDDVIEAYDTIRTKRNLYAHGLWSTHESGRVFVVKENDDVDRFNEADRREVNANELKGDLQRAADLLTKIREAVEWKDPNPIPHGKRRLTW